MKVGEIFIILTNLRFSQGMYGLLFRLKWKFIERKIEFSHLGSHIFSHTFMIMIKWRFYQIYLMFFIV